MKELHLNNQQLKPVEINQQSIAAGQKVYSKKTLSWYDKLVLGFSNRWLWNCPTKKQLELFQNHISNNHLDVGVGTGYFLDKVEFSQREPRIALLDLNHNCLQMAAERIKRYSPEQYQIDLFEEMPEELAPFDSISINYVLHCLPGNMQQKSLVLLHLKQKLKSEGVLFGSTILGQNIKVNWFARRLMDYYNKQGIFCNHQDSLELLELILKENFSEVQLETEGSVALFVAYKE